MKEIVFAATDGLSLNVSVWDEVIKPRGAVYIAHGMAEHARRYDRFAKRLNEEGYVVLASDERGHGKTAFTLGEVTGDSFKDTVEDTASIIKYVGETYRLPVFLFGHSYGSAVSQRYLQLYSADVVGAVLSGTSYFDCAATKSGRIVAELGYAFAGGTHPAKLIEKLSFGIYNQPVKKEGVNAWLSRDGAEVKKYNEDPTCGFVLTYGFYRSFFRAIGKMYGKERPAGLRADLPLLIAVGGADPVSSNAKLAKKLDAKYRSWGLSPAFKIYPDARHEILNETNRDEVTADVVEFINKCFAAKK